MYGINLWVCRAKSASFRHFIIHNLCNKELAWEERPHTPPLHLAPTPPLMKGGIGAWRLCEPCKRLSVESHYYRSGCASKKCRTVLKQLSGVLAQFHLVLPRSIQPEPGIVRCFGLFIPSFAVLCVLSRSSLWVQVPVNATLPTVNHHPPYLCSPFFFLIFFTFLERERFLTPTIRL